MKPLPTACALGCGRCCWRRFCWPPKRSVNSRMNSSICDWRERSDMRVSSLPTSAFIVTETLTTAGVILAASSEKS